MPASVVDQVFGRHEVVAPTGMQGGSGIQKSRTSVSRGGVSRLADLARGAVDASGPLTMSPAQASRWLRTDRVVRALGMIEVCNKRQAQLSAQLTALEWPTARYASLGNHDPQRDPDEQAAYDEERQRLQGLIEAARNDLDEIFGEDVGPPLDLAAAMAQRKAARDAEGLQAQMADMAMDEPGSPAFRSLG
tara:strand:+ start:238 stop:810 length:573 start_codon:yes stop_codon:yes gene_type:complete